MMRRCRRAHGERNDGRGERTVERAKHESSYRFEGGGVATQLTVQTTGRAAPGFIFLRYSGYSVSGMPSAASRGTPYFVVISSTNGFCSGTKWGTLSPGTRPWYADTHGGPTGESSAVWSWKLFVMICGSAR